MSNQLQVASQKSIQLNADWTTDRIDLLKRTICKGASNDELELFLGQCKRTGLDPFSKQIHAVMRYNKKLSRNVMSIQTGIDGFRLIAGRTGEYEGQTPLLWCGEDGVWVDAWLKKEPPKAAKAGVYRKGFREACFAVALWDEYAQYFFDTNDRKFVLSEMWSKMGALMLGKCAEALVLRKAFPQELSGLYTHDEMNQADAEPPKELSEAQIKGPFAHGKPAPPVEIAPVDAEFKEPPKPTISDLGTIEDYVVTGRIGKSSGPGATRPWTLYIISTENNGDLSTFDRKIFDLCKVACDDGIKIKLSTEPTPKGTKVTDVEWDGMHENPRASEIMSQYSEAA